MVAASVATTHKRMERKPRQAKHFTDELGTVTLCGENASTLLTVRASSEGFSDSEEIAVASSESTAPQPDTIEVVLEVGPTVCATPIPSDLRTTVVVTGTPIPTALADFDRHISVLSVADTQAPAWSVPDVLKQDPSVDIRERGPESTQADLSIRGTSFDQNLVMINGIRVNDVQTGHHALDLAMPFESIEQVEVLHGTGSTIHGADAIGGVVNFQTHKPQARELNLMGGLGDFGWNRQSIRGGFKQGKWTQTATVARDFSSGFAPGRDFRNVAGSAETFYDSSKGTTSVLFAANDRPFGANGFYGPWNAWEKTTGQFFAASQTWGRDPNKVTHRGNFSYRRHTDWFVLFRDRPEVFQNRHKADTYQGNYTATGRAVNDKVSWAGGASYLSEGVNSNVLGDRRRHRGTVFGTITARPTQKLNLTVGLREEMWRRGEVQTNPTVSAGYRLGNGFKIRGQVGRAYRLPTFTDLYYRDPGNVGNPDLTPERAWNYEAGVDWFGSSSTQVSATWFQRQENGTIDWIRSSSDALFQATNFQELTFNGGELQFRRRFERRELSLGYTVIRASRVPTPDITSRYVFNFPRQSFSGTYSGALAKGFIFKTRLGAFNRSWQTTRALWDLQLGWENGRFAPFVQATNLLNTSHEAFQGLAQPGRWLRGGVRLTVF